MPRFNNLELEDFPAGLRVFSDTVNRILSDNQIRPWSPAVDIYETENELALTADVPGVEMKDIDIRMENGTLTLKGERKFENVDQKRSFHRAERSSGTFSRSFALPETVDAERVSADYKNGVLTITLPKKASAKPRTIKVEVNGN